MAEKIKIPHASRYLNHVDIGDGTALLYSGASLCMDLVPGEYALRLAQGGDLSFLSSEETAHLLRRGHLTYLTPRREVAEFRKQVRVILEKRDRLDRKTSIANLCFILTYHCNLSCSYCYQKSLAEKTTVSYMSGDFVDRFFTDYYPQLFPKTPRKLFITLFGGEPLLPGNREGITRVLAYARRRPSIGISVATNATMVPEMADLIGPGRGRIRHIQVTLDGDRQFHDGNRVPASGKPTFDATIAAVRQLIALQAKVSLRLHIHQGKLDSAQNLVAYLEKEKLLGHPQLTVYFSPINTFDSEQNSPADAELFGRLFQEVASKTGMPPSNFDFLGSFLDMQSKKILPKVRFCGAGGDNFLIVDPLGDLYGCYEEAGHRQRRIGILSRGKVRFSQLKESYGRRHLLNLPECLRCSAALLCGGGLPE
ncbi:MAG: 4Fe-4S cluster-binding domain-containing protein [Desulfuromonadaceae bacterium]|nr:4Fe-4S cluster-binding domain-containing protein [Desulfuromonadaceae bacterium]